MLDTMYLIGNGESRIGFDLESLRGKGIIVGCNALYRDFKPDILISVDTPTIREVIESDYAQNGGELWIRMWPGKEWEEMAKGKNIHHFNKIFKPKDFGWASGSSGAYIALKNNPQVKEVYMIGHDIVSNTKTLNNIYKGTDNYFPVDYGARRNINWRNQWRQLFGKFSDVQFYKVNKNTDEKTSKQLPEWKGIKNIKYITYEDMK